MTERAKYTGEYWLSKKAHCFPPGSPLFRDYDGKVLTDRCEVPEQSLSALRRIADRERPVRIRLTLTAEVVYD